MGNEPVSIRFENLLLKSFVVSILLLEWLLKSGCPYDSSSMNSAIQTNDICLIDLLVSFKCPMDDLTFNIAAKFGNIRIMRILQSENCPINVEEVTSIALSKNVTKVFKRNGFI